MKANKSIAVVFGLLGLSMPALAFLPNDRCEYLEWKFVNKTDDLLTLKVATKYDGTQMLPGLRDIPPHQEITGSINQSNLYGISYYVDYQNASNGFQATLKQNPCIFEGGSNESKVHNMRGYNVTVEKSDGSWTGEEPGKVKFTIEKVNN